MNVIKKTSWIIHKVKLLNSKYFKCKFIHFLQLKIKEKRLKMLMKNIINFHFKHQTYKTMI